MKMKPPGERAALRKPHVKKIEKEEKEI